MKLLLLFTLLLAFAGCREAAQSTVQNGNFQVEFLFKHDGCNMYRFKDGTRFIYWSDCKGRTQSDYTTSNGKTSTTHHEESITTY